MLEIKKKYMAGAVCVLLILAPNTRVCHAATKNVILMISDGQGIGNIMAADFYTGKKAVYEFFPVKYLVTTYCSNGSYNPGQAWKSFDAHKNNPTDSAAAATAMATGVKTDPGLLGKTPELKNIKNIVEIAENLGKATGVVTSVEFSHATPAGMVAHSNSRKNFEDIARYMIYESGLDVIMGAGHPFYDDDSEKKIWLSEYKYVGGEDVYKDLTAAAGAKAVDGKNWKYIESVEDFEKAASGAEKSPKLLGLARVSTTLQQSRKGDPWKADFTTRNKTVPTLAIMAKAAINTLSLNNRGFFLMIEGGAVDWANHANQKGRAIEEEAEFNGAVESVVEWVTQKSSWDETLLIVTADHETGYIWGTESNEFVLVKDRGADSTSKRMPEMFYHSKNHSNTPVPLYAKGKGSDFFKAMIDGNDAFFANLIASFDPDFTGNYIDNTDIFRVMNSAMQNVEEVDQAK